MKPSPDSLEERIVSLLNDPAYRGHPLREALGSLWEHSQEQLARLERIAHISDAFQAMARERELGVMQRFDRQMKRLGKVARISDRYQVMMRDMNQKLQDLSVMDPLTGLYNRRMVMDRLRDRGESSYSVILIDLDHFKAINDSHGHEIGDVVLVEFAKLLRTCVRENEVCARWGGEEFLVLLPGVALEQAVQVAYRLRDALRERPVSVGDLALSLSVSSGVSQHRDGESYSETIQRADTALYEAKQKGRDCISHR